MSLISLVFLVSAFAADTKYLTVGKIAPVNLGPGQTAEVTVPVKIEKEFHIQAHETPKPYIPTTLTFENAAGFTLLPSYPAGKPYRLKGVKNEISVYDGSIEIKVSLTADSNAKLGLHELKGKLRYQACNDKICFFPKSAAVAVPVRIAQ